MTKQPTSIRLNDEAAAAYEWLKDQIGGFNLNKAVEQMLIKTAKQRGWKGLKK